MTKTTIKVLVGLFLSLCLLCFGVAGAQEKGEKAEKGEKPEAKLKVKDLPPAVQKTVEEQSKGATMKGLSKEVENGKTQYELELMVKGHTKDMIIDESGTVLEVEESVSLASLPAAAKAGVLKGAGKGKILRVEALSKGGTLSVYEVQVQHGTKKSEFQVNPDGTPVPAAAKK
jgi:uncharacterized membrane protein YkoI